MSATRDMIAKDIRERLWCFSGPDPGAHWRASEARGRAEAVGRCPET